MYIHDTSELPAEFKRGGGLGLSRQRNKVMQGCDSGSAARGGAGAHVWAGGAHIRSRMPPGSRALFAYTYWPDLSTCPLA
eukprot:366551-Chlamydomonas_euryale.AAC.31